MKKLMAAILTLLFLLPASAWCAEELKIFTWS